MSASAQVSVSVHLGSVEHTNPRMLYTPLDHQLGIGSHTHCMILLGNPKEMETVLAQVLVSVHQDSVAHRSPHRPCAQLDHQLDTG